MNIKSKLTPLLLQGNSLGAYFWLITKDPLEYKFISTQFRTQSIEEI